MKKLIISLLVVFTLLLTGCSKNNINNISYEELNTKLEAKESFVLYVGTDSTLKTTLNKFLDDHTVTVYSLDTDKLTDEEKTELAKKIGFDGNEIIFIKEGVDSSKKSHITNEYAKASDLETQFTNMGFLSKKAE